MTRLRDDLDDLAALSARAGEHFGIPEAFVEKDYWVTELLRSVAKPSDDAIAIFKGGTSLSKAYGLIERFSEDVDILLLVTREESKGFGKGSIDKILKRICARAGRDLDIPPERQKTFGKTGVRRDVRYVYDAQVMSGALKEGVLLEMGCRGGPTPRASREIRSIISGFARVSGIADETEFEELAPFEIDVLAPERTLIEKLALLHRLASSFPESETDLTRAGRHLYDIHQILGDGGVVAVMSRGSSLAAELAADADEHSRRWNLAFVPRPEGGFADSPAFDLGHPCTRSLRAGYEAARDLIYGPVPTFTECIESVRSAADLL